jgi:thiamine-phosphate pyrophosphorylase
MEADFKIIVITPEQILADEAERIAMLFDSGCIWRVHIRHPKASCQQIENILSALPQQMYNRISLHDNYELAKKYRGVSIHKNRRNSLTDDLQDSAKSTSCHSLDEVLNSNLDYVTLSPIYNSISKSGYNSAFNLEDTSLHNVLKTHCVIALGGVTPNHFKQLKATGFAGAALLGYVWQDDINEFKQRIKAIQQHLCFNS